MRFYFCNDITFHSFNIFQDLFSLFFLNIFFFFYSCIFFSGTQQTHYWWKRPNKPLVFSVPLKSCSFTDSATFFIYIFTFWRQKYSHSCFPTHPTQKKKKNFLTTVGCDVNTFVWKVCGVCSWIRESVILSPFITYMANALWSFIEEIP